jgi:hypothetical protein
MIPAGNMQSNLAVALKKYGFGGSIPANSEHVGHLQRMAGLEDASGAPSGQQPPQDFDEVRIRGVAVKRVVN